MSRLTRLRSFMVSMGLGSLASAFACGETQEGYYSPCNEPGGLAVGCELEPETDFDAWDACAKLARCGVILVSVESDDPNAPEIYDRCVNEVLDAAADQGQVVLACIESSSCPDLARTDPESVEGEDPNPTAEAIEGVIGYCGRLDP